MVAKFEQGAQSFGFVVAAEFTGVSLGKTRVPKAAGVQDPADELGPAREGSEGGFASWRPLACPVLVAGGDTGKIPVAVGGN